MINISNLSKVYRTDEVETVALENVSLDIAEGEFVSIMGPSGWKIHFAKFSGTIGYTDKREYRDCRTIYRGNER